MLYTHVRNQADNSKIQSLDLRRVTPTKARRETSCPCSGLPKSSLHYTRRFPMVIDVFQRVGVSYMADWQTRLHAHICTQCFVHAAVSVWRAKVCSAAEKNCAQQTAITAHGARCARCSGVAQRKPTCVQLGTPLCLKQEQAVCVQWENSGVCATGAAEACAAVETSVCCAKATLVCAAAVKLVCAKGNCIKAVRAWLGYHRCIQTAMLAAAEQYCVAARKQCAVSSRKPLHMACVAMETAVVTTGHTIVYNTEETSVHSVGTQRCVPLEQQHNVPLPKQLCVNWGNSHGVCRWRSR